ncbi:hypothetical protein EXT43_12655 [Pseudoalteromonas sp. CO109Y]|uniref:putative phage abortive infection protein n=1 Tax=Pseudoalteromonas sp. CO109Y TaxID=1777235 RepID=UPI001023280A|nr:putative phage abortive infection protein [Pseudoalteromonas sp. CO109Y]RZF81282.1 hypothetical protein EXT43_12655 [Pseudoalteromonas sp. CO109Y]
MKWMIILICCLAVAAGISAFLFYIDNFGIGFAQTIGDWGAVGDFFGGVLNPIFAFLSLILIAHTLMQNKKALEQSEQAIQQGTEAIEQNERALQVSNQELALTRNELANSATALEEQAKLLAVQSFETTFFNMLELHGRLLDKFNYNHIDSHDEISQKLNIPYFEVFSTSKLPGIDSLNRLISAIQDAHQGVGDKSSIVNVFNAFYLYENRVFGSYFRNLYQILKLIKTSITTYQEQKKYSNILRAQLSNQELTLLLLNCLCSEIDNGQFRKLVLHFELLEHLDITYKKDKDHITTFTINNPTLLLTSSEIDQYLSLDSNGRLIRSAFGLNYQILKYNKFRNMVDQ